MSFCVVGHSNCGAARLRNAEIHFGLGVGVPGLLIEDQVAGGQMNGILKFFGWSLVGAQCTLWISFEVNLDLALAGDVAGLRIVFEALSVNLIEAAGILSIQCDGDIVQLGTSALLELDGSAGLHLEDGVSLGGTGDGEALGGLLNVDANFAGNLLERVLHPMAGVEVSSRHHQHKRDGADHEPAAKAGDGNWHWALV